MAYCPDDGIQMNAICLDYHACYDCSECGTHWSYVDGVWASECAENCPIHIGVFATCQTRTKPLAIGVIIATNSA